MKKIKRSFLLFGFAVLLVSCVGFLIAISASAKTATNDYYLSEKSNVYTIHATTLGAMPCIGEARIVVFYVDFEDGETLWTKTKGEVEQMFFSEEAKNDPSLAYTDKDSIRSYYYRSSYGKVDITGSVFEYHAKESVAYYEDESVLYNEIVAHFKNLIDWDSYDGNSDSYIDGIYIIAKDAPNGQETWPISYVTGGTYLTAVDSKTTSNFSFIGENRFETILHETCHMFGVPDMYAGVNLNPDGIGTKCIMENGKGDLPSPTKFVFGWLDNVTFVNSDNIGSFDLRSYSNHGDVLVVYPNGDETNRNWFFLEYVTNDGNNGGEYPFANTYGEYGIRVWRTQMMLDEDYDIIGEGLEFGLGGTPSPYEYLDTLHPWGILNYYMQVGDEITPYTEISTAYSDTFYSVGRSKYLKDLTFSGICISFEKLQNLVATVKIDIEQSPDASHKVYAELTTHSSDKSSAFIDSNDLLCFASITADRELKSDSPVRLISKGANLEYEVETVLSYNQKTIQLYVETEKLKTLKKYNDWTLSISDLTTYYGSAVILNNNEYAVDFSNYVSPLIDNEEQYSTGFNMQMDTALNYRFRYFKLSDNIVLSIYFDDTVNKLYWSEIDTTTNTTQITQLLVPKTLNLDEWMNTLDRKPIEVWTDGDGYFVYVGNYICCYQDKTLISYFDCNSLNTPIYPLIKDNNAFFIDISSNFYKMTFENNVISLNKVDIGKYPDTNHGIEAIYSVAENRHLIFMSTYVRLVDTENNIVKDYYFTEDECLYKAPLNTLYYLNGYYYVFSAYQDLTLYKFDKDFNLLSQAVVLKDFDSTIIGCYRLDVDFYNNTWVVSIYGTSLGYSNTYLLLCAQNGQVLNYYKYGDATTVSECRFVPISAYKILMIDENFGPYAPGNKSGSSFSYIYTACDSHELGDWVETLAPTCIKEGYNKRSCAKCDYFETQDIPRLAHSFSDWIEVLAPTCTEKGAERRDCSECDYFETKDIRELGHHDIDNDEVCDLCGWKETTLSVGAVVGIVIGSVAAVGVVGLSLLRFVIKKKRISDLFKK